MTAQAQIAPWRTQGIGAKVTPGQTPLEMMEAAGLNWEVEKVPLFAQTGGIMSPVDGKFGLARKSDSKILDIVGTRFIPNQNATAFDFFNKFVEAGRMTMDTAGSFDNGRYVFALARMQQLDFALANDDLIESYLLLCNPHVLGLKVHYLYTTVRVRCLNSLRLAIRQARKNAKDNGGEGFFSMSHCHEFTADVAKEAEQALGLSAEAMKTYKETAQFLTSKKATKEMVEEYFARLYQPNLEDDGEYNRNMTRILDIYSTQPGAELSPGTWWTAFNAVTYFQDHVAGRTVNNRMKSSWFGPAAALKQTALEKAVEYAKVA